MPIVSDLSGADASCAVDDIHPRRHTRAIQRQPARTCGGFKRIYTVCDIRGDQAAEGGYQAEVVREAGEGVEDGG